MKTGTLIAIILFSVVALAHLLRLLMNTEVTVGGWLVPVWLSAVGVVVPAGVALLLYRQSR